MLQVGTVYYKKNVTIRYILFCEPSRSLLKHLIHVDISLDLAVLQGEFCERIKQISYWVQKDQFFKKG